MKIELTVYKNENSGLYQVKATTSIEKGSKKPDSKEINLFQLGDFVESIVKNADENGKIGTK